MPTTIKDHTRVDNSTQLIGRTIGKYRVLQVVGKGGMGCVYEAVNTSINKHVAIKCIDPDLARNEEACARFQREALAASAIESPHIVQIFDAGRTDRGQPFIVMELLRGEDLGRYITGRNRLELEDALNVTAQILKGLAHAHDAGIVHRDLKPDNVFLVMRDDEPTLAKLLDFGVSKIARPGNDVPLQTLTRQGTVVGTPFYMSPEQAQAFPDVDERTDIYSVGAILYECLSGRPPHVGRAYEQVIVTICMKDAEDIRTHNPAVPDGVAAVIHKALNRERDERYQSAREMLAALAEQSPVSLDIATSSPKLAAITFNATTPRPTPHVVRTPTSSPASELADTVGVSHPPAAEDVPDDIRATAALTESGISHKSLVAETIRSSGTRRSWPVFMAPGVAIMVALALWLKFSATAATDEVSATDQATPAEAEVAEEVDADPVEMPIADTKGDPPAASAEPSAKVVAARPVATAPPASRPAAPPAKPAAKAPAKPAATQPAATQPDPKVPAPPASAKAKAPPEPKLELVETY